jgi:hypothetical protein
MNNYKGQRENFKGSVGLQVSAKQVTETVDIFQMVLKNRELIDKC